MAIQSFQLDPQAQKNSEILQAEIEAKLVGVISSHSHSGGGSGVTKTITFEDRLRDNHTVDIDNGSVQTWDKV
jgi:hypothetical protein